MWNYLIMFDSGRTVELKKATQKEMIDFLNSMDLEVVCVTRTYPYD